MFRYKLTPTTQLIIQKGDITRFTGGAIVNAANERMLGGGGVDGAIYQSAGPDLFNACLKVPEVRPGIRCPTGDAKITPGRFGSLNIDYIIHTVGPIYDDDATSAPLLASAYSTSLRLANEHKLKSIAFPAISCGVFGYPLDKASRIALQALQQEQDAHGSNPSIEDVHFMLFGDKEMDAWKQAAEELLLEIEESSSSEHTHSSNEEL